MLPTNTRRFIASISASLLLKRVREWDLEWVFATFTLESEGKSGSASFTASPLVVSWEGSDVANRPWVEGWTEDVCLLLSFVVPEVDAA